MIGERVGNYLVIRKLGEGGMGTVYLAEHVTIGRKAAIKVLLPEFTANPSVVNRFFNEARAAAMTRHPGFVEVFDFGNLPDGNAYLAMEFLDGQSLGDRIREGVLEPPMIVAFARQIAGAIGVAHARGIVHRDLKPDNVFLSPDPEMPFQIRVKILDFGIAKLIGEAGGGGNRTHTSAILGTPAYMSPEQCRGAGMVDHSTDIYALGCIMFEMACGRPPFVAHAPGDVMVAHLRDTPPPVTSINPLIPSFLERIIMRALSKQPEDRPATMADVVGELDSYTAAASRQTVRPPTGRQSTTLGAAAGEARPLAGKSKTSWALIGIAAIGAGVGGAWWMVRNESALGPPALPAATVVAAPAPVTKEPPPSAPSKVRLSITSDPPGAQLFRAADGVMLGLTPTVVTVDATEGRIPFLMKLDGYADEKFDLHADKHGAANIALQALSLNPAPKSHGRSASKKTVPHPTVAAQPPKVDAPKVEAPKVELPRPEPPKPEPRKTRGPAVLDP